MSPNDAPRRSGAGRGSGGGSARGQRRQDARRPGRGAATRREQGVAGYLATFPSGFESLVARLLHEDCGDVTPEAIEDGLVVFRSRHKAGRFHAVPYLNNCFRVLQRLRSDEAGGAEGMLRRLIAEPGVAREARRSVTKGERSFRVVLSSEGRTLPCSPAVLRDVESWLARATGCTPNRRQPDTEFWLLQRRGGQAFFTKRISRRGKTERDLAKGELRPEVAHLLCRMSNPDNADVFLDPFAGSGAVPLTRASWPFGLIFAVDADQGQVDRLRGRVKEIGSKNRRVAKRFVARLGDARRLERFEDGFVDKIVTDPPWGRFGEPVADLPRFYADWLAEVCRVLKRGGSLVVLTGQKSLMADLATSHGDVLREAERYDVLVAGQKAAAFRFTRL